MKRSDLPPWLSEIEKDLAMSENRRGRSDRRGDRMSFPRDRRKGFRVPKQDKAKRRAMAMTDKKILEALDEMRNVADDIQEEVQFDFSPDLGVEAKRINPDTELDFMVTDPEVFAHVLFMLEETKNLVRQGKREKAFRWLGFLQGVMWAQGWCSLEVLKKMNMPDEPLKQET